jgi:hypothetical protein
VAQRVRITLKVRHLASSKAARAACTSIVFGSPAAFRASFSGTLIAIVRIIETR